MQTEMSIEQRTMARVRWRLVPFCMLLFVINYLDRVNVSFAALQMNQQLGFSKTVFGAGTGIFFLGYVLFEVPSNLILQRVGARRWIARIMVSWGIVACLMMFVHDATSFYLLRFLLGVAEAGFFPGILLYFSLWFPARQIGRTVAGFMAATAIANIVGAPVSGALLELDGWMGLHGWQILFLMEGIPAILLAGVVLVYLTDRPEQARWLSAEERSWLAETLRQEAAAKRARAVPDSLMRALLQPQLYVIAALCFFLVASTFGLVLWLPQIVQAMGVVGTFRIGVVSALPYVLAAPAMVFWGWRSDRTKERRGHAAAAMMLGAVGLVAGAMTTDGTVAFAALCVTAVGIWSSYGAFWAMPTMLLSGTAAAGGLALVNSFGNIGAFVSPIVIGRAREVSGGFALPLLILAGSLMLAAVLSLLTQAPPDPATRPVNAGAPV